MNKCNFLVPDRFREEVAFTSAALNGGVSIEPVSSIIQSYVEDRVIESSLFHYGGESNLSKQIKDLLKHPLPIAHFEAFKSKGSMKNKYRKVAHHSNNAIHDVRVLKMKIVMLGAKAIPYPSGIEFVLEK